MPSSAPRVTVVIPNWNGLAHLPECLECLSAQSFSDSEVIVVDNASTDDSVQWVQDHCPDVRTIRRVENGGFAAAVNEGIRVARGDYVALLNNDTAVGPRWLEALVEALDERHDYDLAASQMVFYDDPARLNAAGDVYALGLLAGRNRGFGKPVTRFAGVERVLGACAGAALYRRSLFDEVGLFDEEFFLTSEDTDFNLRCLIAGRKCLYVPGARVRHKYRASVDTTPQREMARLASRNEALVAAKDLPFTVLLFLPLLWPWRFLRQTILVRPSSWHLVPTLVCRAPARIGAEIKGARLGWAKRPQVWGRRAVRSGELLRWLAKGSGPV